MTKFDSVIADAARALSSAKGGQKQPTGPDVLVVRFEAPTMGVALRLALKPLEVFTNPFPYRIHAIRTPYVGAVVDVELRLDQGSEPQQ